MKKLALSLATLVLLCFGFFVSDRGLKAHPFFVLKTYTTIESLAQDGTRAIEEMASLDVRVVSFENFQVSARVMDVSGMYWTLRLRVPRLTPSQADLLSRTDQAHVTFLVTNVLPVERLVEGTLYNVTASRI
jgi:hypothetical protein